MKKHFVNFAVLCVVIISPYVFAENMSIYDSDGNYSWGTVDQSGNMSIYDSDGNYSWGTVDQ